MAFAEEQAKKARDIAVSQATQENEARRIAEEEHKKTLLENRKWDLIIFERFVPTTPPSVPTLLIAPPRTATS